MEIEQETEEPTTPVPPKEEEYPMVFSKTFTKETNNIHYFEVDESILK